MFVCHINAPTVCASKCFATRPIDLTRCLWGLAPDRGFFAAGGIHAEVLNGTPAELGKGLATTGCILACLCGSDDRYAAEAADAARALGAAGVSRLYLAGKPGDKEATLREAGIDEFIHVGVDVVACLEIALSELGLSV